MWKKLKGTEGSPFYEGNKPYKPSFPAKK